MREQRRGGGSGARPRDRKGKVSSYLPPPPLPPRDLMYRQEPFCVRLVFCEEALGGEEVVKMSLGRRRRGSGPARPRRRFLPPAVAGLCSRPLKKRRQAAAAPAAEGTRRWRQNGPGAL